MSEPALMSRPRAAGATIAYVATALAVGWLMENFPATTLGTASIVTVYAHFRGWGRTDNRETSNDTR